MTSVKQLPYLICQPDKVTIADWTLISAAGAEPLLDRINSWDPAVPIEAQAAIEIDVPGLFSDCGLSDNAAVRAGIRWISKGTGLRGAGNSVDLTTADANKAFTLTVRVNGVDLGAVLELAVAVVLVRAGARQGPLAAKRPGSILFSMEPPKAILLEGEGSRFPVELIDFSAASSAFPAEAAWVLRWDSDDLEQTVLGDMRLYVNAGHENVKRAVTMGLPEDAGIREAIRYDLARTLIGGALTNREFVERPESFGEGTVGAAVRNLLAFYFPQTPLRDLQANSQHPQSFEPKLQAKIRAFWED